MKYLQKNETLKNRIGSNDEKWLKESKAKLLKQINEEKRANLIMSRMEKQMNKQYQMASIPFNKASKSEFYNVVSKKHKVPDFNINQLKLGVHDTYKKDEKITTNFEPMDIEDVINKANLEEKSKKVNGHISHIEEDYNELKVHSNKQSIEGILVQRAVKTTIQTFYDKVLFDSYSNAHEVLKMFLFTRSRPDLRESKWYHW